MQARSRIGGAASWPSPKAGNGQHATWPTAAVTAARAKTTFGEFLCGAPAATIRDTLGHASELCTHGRVQSTLEILIKLEHGPCLRDAKLACVSEAVPLARTDLVQRAFRLEWLTIGWMTIEALVAVGSGIAARSVTLLAFGLDSIIELASAGVLIWRLTVEMKHDQDFSEAAEERASKLAAALLFGLAIYVVVSAGWSLWHRQGADFSLPGVLVAIVAIPAMYALSRAKIRVADALGSRALRADAAEAITCGYLSVAVVIGLIAQILFRAWWVDGVTSLAIVYFLLKEGREAWQGDDCCE